MTQYLDVPGGRLAYEVSGAADAPLVVCVHGMGDTRAAFRFLAPRLVQAGHRVALLDVRGHGGSSTGWPEYSATAVAGDVLALIRHLGGPAVIVGHSFAGGSGVVAATDAPEDVSGLVLLDAVVRDAPMNPLMRLAAKLVTSSSLLWSMYYRSLYPTAKPADFGPYLTRLRSDLSRPGRMAAVGGLMSAGQRGTEERLGRVRCPAWVIMGTKDGDFPDPEAEAERTRRQLTGAASVGVTLVENAGHYPHVEFPDVTGDAVVGFLAGVPHA